MDINTVTDMLNNMPVSRTDYEFKNFNLEQYGTFPRQLRAVLVEKEVLYSRLLEIEAEIEILKDETAHAIENSQPAIVKRNAARSTMLNRELTDIRQQTAQVDKWLDSQDLSECQDAIENFEDYESDHWVDTLGKDAAIEVLSHGRTQKITMAQLSQLPLSDYKRAVVIIAQLANFLKDTTEQAEAALYPQLDQIPSGTQQAS